MKFLKNYLRSLTKTTVFAIAALLGFAGVATAQLYYGFNPTTGLNTQQGTPVMAGILPVITTNGCTATLLVGGAGAFQFTAGATSCTMKFTFPAPAPNGYNCVAQDETTPADTVRQSLHDTVSCTITGTVVVADKVLVEVNGF